MIECSATRTSRANPALAAFCSDRGLPLHVFEWGPKHSTALYLIRPDAYVALADPAAKPSVLEQYFARRGFVWARRRDWRSAAK